MLAAGIGALDFTEGRGGVVTVDSIQENNTRITIFPGLFDQCTVNFGRIQFADMGLIPGVDEIILGFIGGRFHKGVGNAHGNIEIVQIGVVPFAEDEFHDIGVVHF